MPTLLLGGKITTMLKCAKVFLNLKLQIKFFWNWSMVKYVEKEKSYFWPWRKVVWKLNNILSKNILDILPSNHVKGFNSDQQRLPGPVENLNLLWSSDGWHTWDKRYDKTANVASSYFSSKVFKSGLILRELNRHWNISFICNLNIVWCFLESNFFRQSENTVSKDLRRDDWIKEVIKGKWSSGLFWAVGLQRRKNSNQP